MAEAALTRPHVGLLWHAVYQLYLLSARYEDTARWDPDADDPVVCSCPDPDVTAVGMCTICGRKPGVLLGRFPTRAGRLSEVVG